MTSGYPTISLADCKLIARAIEEHTGGDWNLIHSFDDSEIRRLVVNRKPHIFFPEEVLNDMVYRSKQERQKGGAVSAKKNLREESFARLSIEMVRELPPEAIQDLDFWRYLGVFHFRDYIKEVEGDFAPARYGGEGNKSIIRWTLIRGLVWGLHTAKDEDYSYISKLRETKESLGLGSGVRDIYISHVVRPSWAKAPGAGRAYIDALIHETPLFDIGKDFRPSQVLDARVGRLSANLYFPALTEEQLLQAFIPLRDGIPHELPNIER